MADDNRETTIDPMEMGNTALRGENGQDDAELEDTDASRGYAGSKGGTVTSAGPGTGGGQGADGDLDGVGERDTLREMNGDFPHAGEGELPHPTHD